MEIVRGLSQDFQVYFVNGGQVIPAFEIPVGVEVINLPALKTDPEFRSLQVVDDDRPLEVVQAARKHQLLEIFERIQPDLLIIELFPFGRKQFKFELIPLLDRVQALGRKTKVVCSLRDIVVGKKDQAAHEAKVCDLINRYFDLVLVHSDESFMPLEVSFSRERDLQAQVTYTGYVTQPIGNDVAITPIDAIALARPEPMMLCSIGGGRFGHELVQAVIQSAPQLAQRLPHHIHLFAGVFMPDAKYAQFEQQVKVLQANGVTNLSLRRHTSCLLDYMQQADLSISMGGYNTTMNILSTGVRSLMLTFMGNDDQEQEIRARALERCNILDVLTLADLVPDRFAAKVVDRISRSPAPVRMNLDGVAQTRRILQQFITAGAPLHRVAA
ncbi:MAG: glycosyl transferase [Synechococcales cyanobacterium CRU_2_2]|nr:glycosyl transferase [Synechococcales cyanobacterium CRU_2_2]